MKSPLRSETRVSHYIIPAVFLVTIAAWFLFFDLNPPFDPHDVPLEGVYLLTAVFTYLIIIRLRLPVIRHQRESSRDQPQPHKSPVRRSCPGHMDRSNGSRQIDGRASWPGPS